MLPRTLTLVLAAACTAVLAVPVLAQDAGGTLAPGSYQLRLPGAGSIVAEVADGGDLATLVVPAAVEITLTAGGELVIDDLLSPVAPDPPIDVATAPTSTPTEAEVAPTEDSTDESTRGRGRGQDEDDDGDDDDGREERGNGGGG